MIINIHFNNKNIKDVNALYLFYRLRTHASMFGGSFESFKFTKNERYKVLPKLVKLGWVYGNKVSKYRNLVKDCIGTSTRMGSEFLNSIEEFKGFLLASLEASQLRSVWRRQNGKSKIFSPREKGYTTNDWDESRGDQFFFKVKKINRNSFSGRVFNSSISKLTGVSSRSISRWRKYSINEYQLKSLTNSLPFIKGREFGTMFRNKDLMYITKDLLINSNIDIFTSKYSHLKVS